MGTNLSKGNLKRKLDHSDSRNVKKFKHPETARDEDDQKILSFSLQDGKGFYIDSEGTDQIELISHNLLFPF